MVRSILKTVGLTEEEIRVYLSTLSLGSASVSSIASHSWIKRPSAYPFIKKLLQKWFINMVVSWNCTMYSAVSPDLLIDKFKLIVKKAQVSLDSYEKILPYLNNVWSSGVDIKVEVYEWTEWLRNMYKKMIDSVEVIYSFEKNLKSDLLSKYFKFLMKSRINRWIMNKVICPNDNTYNRNNKNEYREVKLIDKEKYPFSSNIKICQTYVGIYFLNAKKPKWILIHSEDLANHYQQIFNLTWDLLG